jgi:predicted porin
MTHLKKGKKMKKSFLALAVLGAFAGAAQAQSNVTLYGIVDAGINYDNGGSAAGKTWRLQSGQQSGSRVGFKGTEDLGGGLSAIFTLESGFNTDDGTMGQGGRLFGRQAWVGLNSQSLGTIKLGRQQTPLYYAADAVDPFHINQAGNLQAAFGYGLYLRDPLSRSDNTISYTTPNFAGATATVSYGFGEVAGSFSSNRNVNGAISYVNGPINLQLVYDRATAPSLALAGNQAADFAGFFGVAATPAPALDVRTSFLGGTYDFSVAKLHLAFADTRADLGGASIKDRNYLVGVSAPVGGAGSVQASWIRNDLRDVPSGVSNQYAVGYTYAVSKRTNFYTSAGYTRNNSGVRLNAAIPGDSDRTFQFGVRHIF